MSQTKVYENVKIRPWRDKRIVSGNESMFAKILGTVLLFLLLLPYVITSFFGNIGITIADGSANQLLIEWEKELKSSNILVENITDAGRERIPLEIYLLDKLARSISTDFHLEALKAQAILLRTALIEELWNSSGSIRGTVKVSDPEYGRGEINENVVNAVITTNGVILTYNDMPAKAAYFAVSNGRTRDSGEAFGQGALPYFKAVDCNRDFLAENFTSQKAMTKNEFIQAIEKNAKIMLKDDFEISDLNINRDLGGYIIDITINNASSPVTLSGEEARYIWGLNSSCFSIDENKNKIIFSMRGVGHGLGMSQYAANEMAKNEKDYILILEYFFSGTMLTKFE